MAPTTTNFFERKQQNGVLDVIRDGYQKRRSDFLTPITSGRHPPDFARLEYSVVQKYQDRY